MEQWLIGLSITLIAALISVTGGFIAVWRKLGTVETSIAAKVATSEAVAKDAASRGDQILHTRINEWEHRLSDCRKDCDHNYMLRDDAGERFDRLEKQMREGFLELRAQKR